VTLQPGSVWDYPNLLIAMHGQPSEDDSHVPIILWGRGVRRGSYPGRMNTVDIAPTLSVLLGVSPLSLVDGHARIEALDRGISVVQKQSANQIRRIEELQVYVRTVDHVRKMVSELESNRAANPKIINNICGSIARELSHMRQRALTRISARCRTWPANWRSWAGRAGTGINMKVRALAEGVNSMTIQLDQALKMAHEPEKDKDNEKRQS